MGKARNGVHAGKMRQLTFTPCRHAVGSVEVYQLIRHTKHLIGRQTPTAIRKHLALCYLEKKESRSPPTLIAPGVHPAFRPLRGCRYSAFFFMARRGDGQAKHRELATPSRSTNFPIPNALHHTARGGGHLAI